MVILGSSSMTASMHSTNVRMATMRQAMKMRFVSSNFAMNMEKNEDSAIGQDSADCRYCMHGLALEFPGCWPVVGAGVMGKIRNRCAAYFVARNIGRNYVLRRFAADAAPAIRRGSDQRKQFLWWIIYAGEWGRLVYLLEYCTKTATKLLQCFESAAPNVIDDWLVLYSDVYRNRAGRCTHRVWIDDAFWNFRLNEIQINENLRRQNRWTIKMSSVLQSQ